MGLPSLTCLHFQEKGELLLPEAERLKEKLLAILI
jgi:hypothetical protein